MTEPATAPAAAPPQQSRRQMAIGNLPAEIKAAIELRRAQNIVAADIAATNWGSGMDLATRRAIAEWGRRHGIDVTKEIDVLGGRPYLNAQFYFNRLARMIEAGRVEYAVPDHIEINEDLLQLGEEGKKEWERRARERVAYGISKDNGATAKSIVVARIKLKESQLEFTAMKWCGNRGRTNAGKFKDPIGEEFPVETSETRAMRRALRLLISYIPVEAQKIVDAEREAEATLNEIIERDAEQQRIDTARAMRQPAALAPAAANDPYGIDTKGRAPRKGEVIEVPESATTVTPAAAAAPTPEETPPAKPVGGPREADDYIDDSDLEERHENRERE